MPLGRQFLVVTNKQAEKRRSHGFLGLTLVRTFLNLEGLQYAF